jgi:hypothetical protein
MKESLSPRPPVSTKATKKKQVLNKYLNTQRVQPTLDGLSPSHLPPLKLGLTPKMAVQAYEKVVDKEYNSRYFQ